MQRLARARQEVGANVRIFGAHAAPAGRALPLNLPPPRARILPSLHISFYGGVHDFGREDVATTLETSTVYLRSRDVRGREGLRVLSAPETLRFFGFGARALPPALVADRGTEKVTARLGPGTVVQASAATLTCVVRALRAAEG
jgi:hypothetical protein